MATYRLLQLRNNIFAISIIAIISIIISIPLAERGLHLVHDDQQVARLYLFDKALSSGQIPPRWVDELGFGFGYPLFVFYPPLVYMLGEIFHLAGFGFIDSIKLVFFCSIIFSALAMYIFAKEFFGKWGGLTASLFYMLVPYRALDIYVRGALAESFSFVWLPLILWSFYKLNQSYHLKYLTLTASFLALQMITHNLIFLPLILFLIPYILFLIFLSKNKKQSVIFNLVAITFSLGLSAFFWMPAVLEKKFTIVDELLLVNLASYQIHFVYPRQLWDWTWGFGGSAKGLADGISFKIGKLHIIATVLALFIALVNFFKQRKHKQQNTNSLFTIIAFAFFVLAAFMTTFYSKFVWDQIKPLGYLQFPWRFLIFSALFSSLSAAAVVYFLRLPVFKILVVALFSISLIATNLKLFRPQSFRSDLTDANATSTEKISWEVSHSSFEYIPRGVELKMSAIGTNFVNITKEDIPQAKAEIVEGRAQISGSDATPSTLEFKIESSENSTVQANIFNFPGWQATINGQKTQIDDQNRLKLIRVNIPQGVHQIKISFENTSVRNLANIISVGSLIILISIFRKKWQTQITR